MWSKIIPAYKSQVALRTCTGSKLR